LSLAFYLYALNGRAYYLAAFAMIAMIGGLIWTFGGTEVAKRLAFPIAYLALMVPLPIVERVTYPLAIFTGICSTGLAQTLGLDVVINGNAVSVPNADMVIGAQCSGINSMISLTALMLLAAYLLDGPLWGRVLLVAMAVPLALLGNILRVASLLFIADEWGAQAAFTYYHDYSGWVFFVIVLLLMLPITRVLQCTSVRTEVI
jgi:exosortase